MKNTDTFSGYHPLVNFLYFALVLVFSMCLMNPACLAISLAAAFAYNLYLNGRRALKLALCIMLPLLLLTAVINPAFNHQGATILTYLPSGNPLTLESIIYGLAAASMLIAVILWFGCYSAVLTSDKFVYLFGRLIPALSLVLSMTLRFVPKFKAQLGQVSLAQQCVGRDAGSGSLLQRLKNATTILSIMVTWALENAIETADSMKSRGYGLPGRTAFSIYRWEERDKNAIVWLLFCGLYILSGWLAGGLYWRYFPTMKGATLSPFAASFYLVYLALCLTPLLINICADWSWRKMTDKKLREEELPNVANL